MHLRTRLLGCHGRPLPRRASAHVGREGLPAQGGGADATRGPRDMAVRAVPARIRRDRSRVGRLGRHVHDPGAPGRAVRQRYDGYGVLAGPYVRPGYFGLCHAKDRGEVGDCGSLSLLLPLYTLAGGTSLADMRQIYLPITIGLELLFWLVPQFYVSAVAIALQGFFLGPLFPAAVVAMTKLLPKHLHVSGIGFAAAFGGSGGAIFPFAVGALAQAKGVQVLQPFILALLVVIWMLWMGLPRINKKSE